MKLAGETRNHRGGEKCDFKANRGKLIDGLTSGKARVGWINVDSEGVIMEIGDKAALSSASDGTNSFKTQIKAEQVALLFIKVAL